MTLLPQIGPSPLKNGIITMDVAYNQHSHANRRKKQRSSTNLNNLTLAPLTTRSPLGDDDYDFDPTPNPYSAPHHTTSYLLPKSVPTTPSLLTHSPARIRSSSRPRGGGPSTPSDLDPAFPKSKSTTHLARRNGSHQPPRRTHKPAAEFQANYSDWLMRAGALISAEARESKGSSWLVSRASSISLAGASHDLYERDDFCLEEQERRWAARHAAAVVASRRNSRGSASASTIASPGSYSRVGSQIMTPGEKRVRVLAEGEEEDYFGSGGAVEDGEEEKALDGPDFVDLDEELEFPVDEVEEELDTIAEDEAYVRRLLKKGDSGFAAWLASMFGVRLFSGFEDEEEGEDGEEGEIPEMGPDGRLLQGNRRTLSTSNLMRIEGVTTALDSRVPPPQPDEGGWKDAAWLLNVAARVIF